MSDTDWVLPAGEVAPYLCAIREHLEFGLDDAEIEAMATAAEQLHPGERSEYPATIVYNGRSLTIKFNFFLADHDSLILGVCADPVLSEELGWTIESVYDDQV